MLSTPVNLDIPSLLDLSSTSAVPKLHNHNNCDDDNSSKLCRTTISDNIMREEIQDYNNESSDMLHPSTANILNVSIVVSSGSSTQSVVFVTASQVALSAALIMGIAAMAMVIYRLCTKSQYLTARQRNELARRNGIRNHLNHNSLTASLSSIQIRVLSRMRDRPPAYNTNTNEDHQHTPTSLITTITDSNYSTSLPTTSSFEEPPPYDNNNNTNTDTNIHLPPPYTEIVLNPNVYLNPIFDNNNDSILPITINITDDENNDNNKIHDINSTTTNSITKETIKK